jgi:hypothetical protein
MEKRLTLKYIPGRWEMKGDLLEKHDLGVKSWLTEILWTEEFLSMGWELEH